MINTNKKLLVVDQDDCISHGGLLYLINEFLNICGLKSDYDESDFKNYYMQDVIPKELKKKFFQYLSCNNIYKYTLLYPNAKEVLKQLNKEYRLVLITDYLIPQIKTKCGENLKNKFEYLCRELPFIDPNNFVFTAVKDIVTPDIAIDDKIIHLKNAKEKILFSAYHNLNISDDELNSDNIERMNNWNQIGKRLLKK